MCWRTPFSHLRGLRVSSRPIPCSLPLQPRTVKTPRILFSQRYASTAETASAKAGGPSQPSAGISSEQEASEVSAEAEDPARKEIEDKGREIIDLKDRYLRSVADFRNLQDRTAREVAAARDFAISRFARDLVDSVDNLDRALSIVPEAQVREPEEDAEGRSKAPGTGSNKDLINLYDGLKMTEKVLMQTLAKHGLERFDPAETGEAFNPNLHEASFMAPMAGKEDGTVFNTIQKGFMLNRRVIRAAKVGVVKNA